MIGRHGPTLRHKPTQAQLPVISPLVPLTWLPSLGVKEGSSRRSLCQKIQTGRTVTRRLLPPMQADGHAVHGRSGSLPSSPEVLGAPCAEGRGGQSR